MSSIIAENLAFIRERMREACLRAGRNPSDVRLVGVTKTVPVDLIREGVAAGIAILGENYVQEARRKAEALAGLGVSWHFIGHLQSNKAKHALECCDLIQTVDRESLAKTLGLLAEKLGREIPVLIQVNVGDEESKSGVHPEGLVPLFRAVSAMDGLDVRGLMTLPPYCEDPERGRPFFRKLRELLEQIREHAARPERIVELSMGMSHDYEAAIEEGATLVRIGTALFGTRPASRDR